MGRTAAVARGQHRSYHHGNLRRALLDEAVATIGAGGVDALTLRGIGARLGVSRTALYRHFADKSALLAAVAREGFRTLRMELLDTWTAAGQGRAGFDAMGHAYIRFAIAHPAHYRVMFGGFVDKAARDPELQEEASGAFQALVDALVAQQAAGLVRPDDPLALARFVWATVHGVAMLAIDGQLPGGRDDVEQLSRFVVGRIEAGISGA